MGPPGPHASFFDRKYHPIDNKHISPWFRRTVRTGLGNGPWGSLRRGLSAKGGPAWERQSVCPEAF